MEPQPLKLVMVQGPREGETLEFPPGSTIRIGRLIRGNNVPIKDLGISSKHLSIESSSSESGKWILRDLDSSNGTLLNATKVLPYTSYDLRNADTIKIGECTSFLVKIDGQDASQLRRNPRRRAAEKHFVEPVAENRSRSVNASKTSEAKYDEKTEELETENPRKGRLRKARVLKSEDAAEELGDSESENVRPLQQKPRRQTSTRRTRSAKESAVLESILEKIPENSGVECGEVEVKGRKTRAGVRRRKNLCQESSDCARVDAAENKDDVDGPAHSGEYIRADVDKGSTTGVDALETKMEENDIINAGKGTACGIDDGVERGAGSGVNEEGLDLERMSLGDWFNYLEVHLPKHIIHETEEMIEGMRQKAERVREYILEQSTEG